MAVACNGPSDASSGNRRLSERLPAALVSRARRQSAESGRTGSSKAGSSKAGGSPGGPSAGPVPDDGERVLRAAVEALLALARRTPGVDLTVSVGRDGPAVRLHYTQEGLVAHRLTARGRTAAREEVGPVFDGSAVVSELASLLWSGEVEPR